jgi:hypothetical protein
MGGNRSCGKKVAGGAIALTVPEYREPIHEKTDEHPLEAVESRLKLGKTHPHTIESIKSLIALYEAWKKPEKAQEWRAKLPQTEPKTE